MHFATEQFAFLALGTQQCAPPAHTRIALAGAVGEYFHDFAVHSCLVVLCVILLFNFGATGSNLLTRPLFHCGLIRRIPGTRLIACRKYTPPLTAHQRSPAFSMKEYRFNHLR